LPQDGARTATGKTSEVTSPPAAAGAASTSDAAEEDEGLGNGRARSPSPWEHMPSLIWDKERQRWADDVDEQGDGAVEAVEGPAAKRRRTDQGAT
jgi:hypothetical protein